MADLTLSSNADTLLQAADYAAANALLKTLTAATAASEANHVFVSGGASRAQVETPIEIDPATGDMIGVGDVTADVLAATSLTVGGVAITASGAELNYVDGVTSAIQTQLNAKGTASDVAYDATSWNANTDVPTKNAVRDKFESLGAGTGFTMDDMQTSTPLIVDDFLAHVGHASIPTGPLKFITGAVSSGVVTSTNGTATAPGWMRFSDGGSATGAIGVITSLTGIRFGTGTFTVEWRFTTPAAASDGTNTYVIRMGFGDSAASVGTDGCYLQYSNASANFRYITRQASTETDTNSALAFAASTTYRVRIVCNATSATFSIDGGSTSAAISTNFPTGTQYMGIFAHLVSSLGTDTTTFDVDYCAFQATGLTR